MTAPLDRGRQRWRAAPLLCALCATLLGACAVPPPRETVTDEAVTYDAPASDEIALFARSERVDESAMLPVLGYLQRLARMSARELARERSTLAAIPPTPATQVRMAALLGQPRPTMDLGRALALLDGVLKSDEPAAVSLHPLARLLASQYQERQERVKLQTQNERLAQQLGESLRRNGELQEKIDALADIERSLPVRPTGADSPAGSAR